MSVYVCVCVCVYIYSTQNIYTHKTNDTYKLRYRYIYDEMQTNKMTIITA